MKVQDIVCVSGHYEQQGVQKARFQKIGSLITKDDGKQSIVIEKWFSPAGATNEKGECWLSIFDQKPRDGQAPSGHDQAKANGYQKQPPMDTTDIPFNKVA